MTYTFREIRNPHELTNLFRLRYKVYRNSRLAGFVQPNKDELDIDAYDLQSRHYGVFVEIAGKQELVGGLRLIEPNLVLSSKKAIEKNELLSRYFTGLFKTDGDLPILCYLKKKERQNLVKVIEKGQNAISEGSRLVVAPEYQSLRLAYFIILNAIAICLYMRNNEIAVLGCNSNHAKIYESLGFLHLTNYRINVNNNSASIFYVKKENIPPSKINYIKQLAFEQEQLGFSMLVKNKRNIQNSQEIIKNVA